MRKLVILIAAILLALWSLFAWAAYGLLGYAGEFAAANANMLPFAPEWVIWMAGLLGGMGAVAVWVVWGLGAAAIVIPTLIVLAFLKGRRHPGRSGGYHSFDHAGIPASSPVSPASSPVSPARTVSGADAVDRVLGRTRPGTPPK